jgi:hypothetical protein
MSNGRSPEKREGFEPSAFNEHIIAEALTDRFPPVQNHTAFQSAFGCLSE